MSIGSSVRRLLGPRLFRVVGRAYRAIFVDLAEAGAAIAKLLPPGSHLLDIGGGDGEHLNHLLALRSDIRVTTLDPAPTVGQWIEPRFESRVTRLPATDLAGYLVRQGPDPDAILMADVLHHIPEADRAGFLGLVNILFRRAPTLRIIVKDVEPGHWRALLGYWSDRYITGDRGVSPVSREYVARLFDGALGPLRREDTSLFDTDKPNYTMAFFR